MFHICISKIMICFERWIQCYLTCTQILEFSQEGPIGNIFPQKSQASGSQTAFLSFPSCPCQDPTMPAGNKISRTLGSQLQKATSSLMRHWEVTATESNEILLWNLWCFHIHFPLESDESKEIYKIMKNNRIVIAKCDYSRQTQLRDLFSSIQFVLECFKRVEILNYAKCYFNFPKSCLENEIKIIFWCKDLFLERWEHFPNWKRNLNDLKFYQKTQNDLLLTKAWWDSIMNVETTAGRGSPLFWAIRWTPSCR